MRIVNYITPVDEITEVKKATYLGDYVIRILFSDNTERAVDFKSFLQNSSHPLILSYLNEKKFKKFIIDSGNLNWNNYELIFPIDDLYNGKIS